MFKNPILVAFLTHFAYFYGKKNKQKNKKKIWPCHAQLDMGF